MAVINKTTALPFAQAATITGAEPIRHSSVVIRANPREERLVLGAGLIALGLFLMIAAQFNEKARQSSLAPYTKYELLLGIILMASCRFMSRDHMNNHCCVKGFAHATPLTHRASPTR